MKFILINLIGVEQFNKCHLGVMKMSVVMQVKVQVLAFNMKHLQLILLPCLVFGSIQDQHVVVKLNQTADGDQHDLRRHNLQCFDSASCTGDFLYLDYDAPKLAELYYDNMIECCIVNGMWVSYTIYIISCELLVFNEMDFPNPDGCFMICLNMMRTWPTLRPLIPGETEGSLCWMMTLPIWFHPFALPDPWTVMASTLSPSMLERTSGVTSCTATQRTPSSFLLNLSSWLDASLGPCSLRCTFKVKKSASIQVVQAVRQPFFQHLLFLEVRPFIVSHQDAMNEIQEWFPSQLSCTGFVQFCIHENFWTWN